ncbi:HlyD family efflux transporter periplasmic adaptor subunit [Mariniphaga sediminis]|uniref:HlyD family efflux transporter periplasmic adaptor subunit n=1 Tax=Mariniphaga sediminis TaxID=1628158 RepID=A0A399D0C1_9BACT|nr:HlyD family efflux transporter periplasmic adaptor subunit [Mariniphaga sediminis]RIH64101.1 HlyD family efflux transporter periplasmic adaptor subunit [Mariniphaga sediminis]
MRKNLFVAALAVLFFSCNNNDEKSDAYGNFEADPVIVSSESSGKILQLNIEKGGKVDAGFVALITDTVQWNLKLKQIEAQKAAIVAKRQAIQSQVVVFEEQIKNLRTNEKRIARMVKDQAATQKQLDDITGQINVIEKQIESTKTQFTSVNRELDVLETQKETTEDLLRRCTIKSPANGTILETYIEQGELATPGKPLFKMANLEELILKVYVSGAQLPHIKIGQQVDVLIDKTATENQTLRGKVTWISPEAEFTPKIIQTKEERVKLVYAVKVAVKNDGTLKIGMPGEISW